MARRRESEQAHAALAALAQHLSLRREPALGDDSALSRDGRALCLLVAAKQPSTLAGLEAALGALTEATGSRHIADGVRRLVPTAELLAELLRVQVPDLERFYQSLLLYELSVAQTDAGEWCVRDSLSRRRGGAHYTPPELARRLVSQCLEPLLEPLELPEELLGLKVCDPAAGAGAFLLAARQQLCEHLELLDARSGITRTEAERAAEVTRCCLYGLDLDPLALWLCRHRLEVEAAGGSVWPRLLRGNALIDSPIRLPSLPDWMAAPCNDETATEEAPFDWSQGFAEVFERDPRGFDAIVGNPPWVAYVGRAAQPLSAELKEYFSKHYASFRKYRTQHGMFIERAANLLRAGGRLGLLLPTSVADLDGYLPTRAAHDTLCETDLDLPDFGDVFSGVFQPCVGLLSTRRHSTPSTRQEKRNVEPAAVEERRASGWSLAREDLAPTERRLLQALEALPTISPELFGERGFQTRPEDRQHFKAASLPPLAGEQPLYTGTEVLEFQRLPERWRVDPKKLAPRFRSATEWQQVALWVRQTARYPIVALANGCAFRNSIIAAFEDEGCDRFLLIAFLNSTPVRWFHYYKQRDARQGMPQLKVGHLRSLPAPPTPPSSLATELADLGRTLGMANRGLRKEERARIDRLVADALHLDEEALKLISYWGERHPPPKSRTLETSAAEASY